MRRDHLAVVRLLRTRGGGRRRLAAFTAAESTWPCVAGGVAAFVATYLSVWAVWGRPVAQTSLSGGLPTALVLTVLAALVVSCVLRWQPATDDRAPWRLVTAAAVATIAAAVLGASRGSTSVEPGAPADPLVSMLPVLTAVAAGLLAARCSPLLPRGLVHLLPKRAAAARLAVAGGGRQPLRAAATVAVLAATCCSVVFAGAYRSTAPGRVRSARGAVLPRRGSGSGATSERGRSHPADRYRSTTVRAHSEVSNQEVQQITGRSVRPVQILQDDDQRVPSGAALEQQQHLLEQPTPAQLAIGIGVVITELGKQPGKSPLTATRRYLSDRRDADHPNQSPELAVDERAERRDRPRRDRCNHPRPPEADAPSPAVKSRTRRVLPHPGLRDRPAYAADAGCGLRIRPGRLQNGSVVRTTPPAWGSPAD